MTIERRNPLPAGRYWVDLERAAQLTFDAWRGQNKQSVQTETTQTSSSGRVWYLFRTSAALPWRQDAWGYPTVAGPEVTRMTDVMQLPAPEPDFSEKVEQVAAQAGQAGGRFLLGLGLVLVAVVVVNRALK